MSEIEKLYENAGIEKTPNFNNCYPEMMKCHHCEHYKVIDEYTGRCLNEVYPEFTAEKQIELIKWLANTEHYIQNISKIYGGKKYYIENERYNGIASSFEEALAEVVNELWQELTKKEKQQIKGILEQ